MFVISCWVILLGSWSEVSFLSFDMRPVAKSFTKQKSGPVFIESKDLRFKLHGENDTIKASLRPGDLPGYTGWARPANTVAGSFSIHKCGNAGMLSKNWTCTVHCDHAACAAGGSLFYVRAYGPAILPGLVTDHGNGTYDVTVLPLDEGIYTVEVVLSFSNHPAWSDFPVRDEPAYEGYLLRGFPVTLNVVHNNVVDQYDENQSKHLSKTKLPVCNMSMLTETSTNSALASGRWVVWKTNMEDTYVNQSLSPASLEKYQGGEMSLGIDMEYVPITCSLTSTRLALNLQTISTCREYGQTHSSNTNTNAIKNPNRSLYVIFIGDSNILLQQKMFDEFFGQGLETTRISTEGGLVATLPNIQERLKQLAADEPNKEYFVIFNAGLHDIAKLCQKAWRTYRAPLIHNVSDDEFSCLQHYRESLTELVTAVAAFPASVRVWQTTTAGWPKWGNYGVAWPAATWQLLPSDPSAVLHWNDVAWEVLQPFLTSNEIVVMDAYWLTLSRPDHRESDRQNSRGKHMVHAGPQVYSVLMRKWAMLIRHAICPSAW
jgi:hypothetical protein